MDISRVIARCSMLHSISSGTKSPCMHLSKRIYRDKHGHETPCSSPTVSRPDLSLDRTIILNEWKKADPAQPPAKPEFALRGH